MIAFQYTCATTRQVDPPTPHGSIWPETYWEIPSKGSPMSAKLIAFAITSDTWKSTLRPPIH